MMYQLHEFNRNLLAPFTELAVANAKIFGADGTWQQDLTLLEFEAPAQFLERLAKVNQ